ncbi:MAG: hypothetical protein DRQ88_08310 [Epsilonproteobacteria bacterium]|nr:MAG: hypothetical protein DRQ89_09045 [Campylobacterota bacterium]RLA65991.1 MAG: hypothetical protein DRQ88_08310 [Campylobacterota bacterium]
MSVKILTGNELIIQGGLEAGFSLYTGYPGSPLADYFNILYARRDEFHKKGIRVAIGNSEANAGAMASGAKQAGRDVCVAMKSMGLHVAADSLSVGNFADPGPKIEDPKTGEIVGPGVVIVVGDDPWSLSTSTPADSRYLYKHLHIPFLEPSTPQELKDWMEIALYISRRSTIYQGILLTTFMAEGGGRVEIKAEAKVNGELSNIDPATFDLSKNVMVPPNSYKADKSMIKIRFPKVKELLKDLKLDQTFGFSDSKIGFISSGVIFETLKQVLEEADYLEHLSLYKTACSYPLVDELLLPFLQKLETLIVVEEKRGFLETELIKLIQKHNLRIKVFGKKFDDKEGFPAAGGLNYEIIRDKIVEALSLLKAGSFKDLHFDFDTWKEVFPRRLPTFCPGCPHRETLSLLKEIRKLLASEDVNLISHGDVGCYSLSFLPPFKEMHNLSAMGQGGALGAGMDMFTTNPSVVLMGDSTFFHSGITDISNSVQIGHNITYIILDNDNTAMTGHQMTPISGVSVEGYKRPRQDMLPIVKNLGVDEVIEVNPSDRYFYRNKLLEIIKKPGTRVVISNKECGLTFHGRRKSHERKLFSKKETVKTQRFYQINTDVCEDCRECVEMTGCPGLSQTQDAYGTKVKIDPQICVADSYCTKLKACPSFELVEVENFHPSKYKKTGIKIKGLDDLPEPDCELTFDQLASGADWRAVVTGVGGSGVTTISRVLAEAAKEMDGRTDLDFKFVDQKGLAQRNGRVTGHMAIFQKGKSYGSITPLGTANLILSPDLLDGSQAINFLSKKGMAILDTDFQMPLSILLDYGEEGEPLNKGQIKSKLEEKLGERVKFSSLKQICKELVGKSVYSSGMILGIAYQSGKLPFTLDNMRSAFENIIYPEELDNNWLAFNLGRKACLEGDDLFFEHYIPEERYDLEAYLIKSINDSFLPWHNKKHFVELFNRNLKRLEKSFPEIDRKHHMQYLHDQIIYNRGVKLEEFIQDAGMISLNYHDEKDRKVALQTLAKCFFIKDETFVAHQMISPMQRYRDNKLYKELGTGYKKTHINRPGIMIFGKHFEFDISPKDWMLKIVRHLRIFRLIMSSEHEKEMKISKQIKDELLNSVHLLKDAERFKRLVQLNNIKGYRAIRYEKALRAI